MSFQFNFFVENDSEKSTLESNVSESTSSQKEENVCFEWKFDNLDLENCRQCHKEFVDVVEFRHLYKRKYPDVVEALKKLENTSITSSDKIILSGITEASDVVPQQYEGGLKTWECSIDLLHLLKNDSEYLIGLGIKKILEVGCGSGLPGIYCQQICFETVQQVAFQDFNRAVLETVTLPNFLLNSSSNCKTSKLKLYYGDWIGLPLHLEAKSFDLILSSETIYRIESYPALLNIFSHSLSESKNARVLLAAKDYYFGLGGSVSQFIKFVESTNSWNIKILKQILEGVPRTILELTRVISE